MSHRVRRIPPWTPFAVASGVAALAALLDQGLRWIDPTVAVSPSALPAVWALYALPALAGALVVVVSRRSFAALLLAAFPPSALAVVLGGWVNVRHLPSLDDSRSLLFDALVLGLFAVAVIFCRRRLVRDGATVWGRAGIAFSLAFGVVVAVVVVRGNTPDGPGALQVSRSEGPDVVVVLFDALRADHCSAYGYERETTPHLDRLAREGALFENVYSVSSWTKPTVATLFTGLYPTGHGNHAISSRLPAQARTLPEVLREAGYATGVFAENRFVSRLFGYARGVDHLVGTDPDVVAQTVVGHVLLQVAVRVPAVQPLLDGARIVNRLDRGQSGRQGASRDMVRSFDAWLDGLDEKQRFFAYVHLMKPHAPYVCPPPFDGAFGEPSPPGGDSPVEPPHVDGLGPLAEADSHDADWRRRLVNNYDERLLYGDDELGRLLELLSRKGREDLIVVVLSDHGEEFGENGLFDHGHSLQEGVVRVPLVFWGPGRIAPGQRIEGVARLLDVPPTILELTSSAPEDQFDGRSLVPAFGDSTAGDRPVLLELEHGPDYGMQGLLRWGDGLKLVRTFQEGALVEEVFDLQSDPGESFSVAVPGEDPLVWMGAELDAARAAAGRRGYVASEAALDPDTESRLRALGYIE